MGENNPGGEDYCSLGRHILCEFWGIKNTDSKKFIEEALAKAVDAAEATLVKMVLHKFSPFGVSGVAVIAESHLSIHTWPEREYAAIDIFTCGRNVKPYKALEVLKKILKPKKVEIIELKRGIITDCANCEKNN